ncbi:MAG: stage II sporulation protein P [Bacillota bacterium]|nr:stage II sporulation protein P [Bacillota bacterium]
MSRKSSSRRRVPGLVLLALLLVAGTVAGIQLESAGRWPFGPRTAQADEFPELAERLDGLHYTLYNPEGRAILQTGLMVTVGDEYVNEDNLHYRVISVENDRCQTVLLGTFSLEIEPDPAYAGTGADVAAQAPKSAAVGVYHTHGDESYTPGDGTWTIRGRGGIFDVAQRLVAESKQAGLTVQYNDTHHAPHDSGAYRRSRRTATALMRQGSGTLLDIHRDTASPEAYTVSIDGRPTSRAMLVVGRSNPQMRTTLNFARSFKSTMDQKYPGLMRGIYFGRGAYNQDLSPRAVLVEIGSHRTPKDQAIRTAGLIGGALADILGVAAPGGGGAGIEGEGRSSWANLAWIVLVVLVGSAVYLVYASGGWRQAADKLRGFVSREFASALAPRRAGTRRPARRFRRASSPRRGSRPGDGSDPDEGAMSDGLGGQSKGGERDGPGKEQTPN